MFNKDSLKSNKYIIKKKIDLMVMVELIMAIYCLIGVVSSIYFLEIAALPFQILFFTGFAFVSFTSIKHSIVRTKS